MSNLRERIAMGECVSPMTTDRCPVCVDECEAAKFKRELTELKQHACDHEYIHTNNKWRSVNEQRCIHCGKTIN